MHRFLGRAINKLDAKGRVSIPANFRDLLIEQGVNGFYCAPSALGANLTGYGEDFFAEVEAKLRQLNPYSAAYAAQATQAFGDVDRLEFDPEGRVRLPDYLIAHAGIRDRVQFIGFSSYFELWNPDTYPAVRAERLALLKRDFGQDGAP
ncbi:MAG: division/cell wall cluster transcriptional repressor MraZ [Alphaproteobacteria bacterium]|nr:division/cell wall cluster transcriptional repressor MraZ [Alphaproteobacteria bacterium]